MHTQFRSRETEESPSWLPGDFLRIGGQNAKMKRKVRAETPFWKGGFRFGGGESNVGAM